MIFINCRRTQRHLDQRAAEGDAIARDHQRFVEASAHHRGGAHAMRKPRQVDLIHHLLEAVAQLADQPCERAFEHDLAAGHRARAELVLQPRDSVAIAAAGFEPARHREQPQPARAGRRALGTGEQQRQVGVGVRAEPFVAVKAPFALFAAGDRFERADVGAAGFFGHELRALPHRAQVLGEQARREPALQLVGAVLHDYEVGRVGDADRAHQAELGLHEQILKGVFCDRR